MSTQPRVLPNVEMNDDLLKAITGSLDPEAIKSAILAEAEKQGAAADVAAAEKAATEQAAKNAETVAADAAAANQIFTRKVVIGNREFEFEAESALELERMVNTALTVANGVQSPAPAEFVEADPTPAEIAAAAEQAAVAKAELELQFKRGEISAKDYVLRSGVFDEVLAEKGISFDAIKGAIETNEAAQASQSWAQATEEFKNGVGADWPGGDKNLHRMGIYLQAMNLTDAENKVDALAQAYTAMKAAGDVDSFVPPVVANPAAQTAVVKAAADKAAADKATVDAAAAFRQTATGSAATVRTTSPTASSLWGASSGVGAGASAGATLPKQGEQYTVPADASPEQIMDMWKKEQLAQGINPDAAFDSQFGNRKR